MTAESDADAVAALGAGDAYAFEQLMRKYAPTVFRYAWAVADSPEQVEDAVQDTFLTLWRRRRKVILHGETLLPWLLTTCRYTVLNANRRRRRRETVPLDEAASASVVADERDMDDLRWIRDEIALLPAADQRLIDACVVRGESYEQAARGLGITAPAARKRMQRIRERLRAAELKEES